MQRSLIVFLIFLQLTTVIQCGNFKCYDGFVGALLVVRGYDMCATGTDVRTNQTQFFGWNGENHIYNESLPIDWSQGPCFTIYEYRSFYDYCYCRGNLCNRPKSFYHILNSGVFN